MSLEMNMIRMLTWCKKRDLPFKSNQLQHNLKINQEELMTVGCVHLISRKLMAPQQCQGKLRILIFLENQGTRQSAWER